jgi:nucleotide-binding universal stress UspA family protein
VQLAFMEAAVRRAPLTAIQVLTPGGGFVDRAPWLTEASTAAHDRATPALTVVINRYAGSFPEVVVAQIVVAGYAIDALREATAFAELLVIGRHGDSEGGVRSLGSVARQLINTARCPILVATPNPTGAGYGPTQSASISDARPASSASSPR